LVAEKMEIHRAVTGSTMKLVIPINFEEGPILSFIKIDFFKERENKARY
jgi:hypothetical protein